jgi:hypothetical protein
MRMLKKCRKKRVKAGLLALLLICSGVTVQAQAEAESNRYADNDNRWYFQDVAIEGGLYTPTERNSSIPDGHITSLYGSYFLTHNLGFRSGASLIMDIEDSPYVKIPCLLAFRSKTLRLQPRYQPEDFKELLQDVILYIIPTRYEINLGPSFGYVWHNRRNFAVSADANFRMGFQFWRIGVNGNMGISYLLTKNFANREPFSDQPFRPVWFANLSVGASFRF